MAGGAHIWFGEALDGEVDDSTADLDGLVEAWEERCSLFNKHKSAKLALIVFKQEFSFLKLNLGMASRN